ncbi:hypothetical protein D3C72_1739950 [compost metagenome]
MGDHHHRLAAVLLRDAVDSVHHAGVELAGGLAAGHAVVGFKTQPLVPCVGVLQLDVIHALAVHHAKVLLTQGAVGEGVDAGLREQHLQAGRGCLPGADEVAADEVVHHGALCSQALGQAAGLFVAGGVEGHIHVALKAQLAVPGGFAVADQDQFSHACHYRMYTH